MATETDIPESVSFKKGEREDDALPSEILQEKVKPPESRPNQSLETSSHVADIVNTQLETGIATNEGGIFFQALSVPKVTTDEKSNKPESCEPTTTEDQEERQATKIEAFTEWKSNDDESVLAVASEVASANDYEPITEDHNVVQAVSAQIEGSNVHALDLINNTDKDIEDLKENCNKDESLESSKTNTKAVNEADLQGTNYISESKEPDFVKTKERDEKETEESISGIEMEENVNYHGLNEGATTDVCVSKQTEPEYKLSVPKVTTDEESTKPESCDPTTTEDQEERQTTKFEAFTEQKPNDDEGVQVVASEVAFANDYEPNTEVHNVVKAISAQTEGSIVHAHGFIKDSYKDIEVKENCNKDESMESSKTNTEAVNEEDLQGTNYISESKEPEIVNTKEHAEEDIKEIRQSDETNDHGLQDGATTDVCVSKQAEPEDKIIENEEKAIESQDGQTTKSGRPLVEETREETDSKNPESEEGFAVSDSIAPVRKEILSKDEGQQKEQAFKMIENDQGDGNDATSSQDATCADIKEMTGQHAKQHLNESPREVFKEETIDESNNSQKASEQSENGAKDKGEQKLEEGVSCSEIEQEKETEETSQSVEIEENLEQKGLLHPITTNTCISTQTKSHVTIVEHEVKDEEDAIENEERGSEKVEYDKEERISDNSSLKLDEKPMTILNKEENHEKEQEVNMSEKEQGEDKVTSSLDVAFEGCLQEKHQHGECNEPEAVKTEEGPEEENEEIKLSVETPEKVEQQRLIDGIPTDVCVSTHIKPEEETTENKVKNDEEAIESDDGQTKKSGSPMVKEVCVEVVSEKPESEEGIKLSDGHSMALDDNVIERKDEDQKTEQQFYVSEKGQGDRDDVTSSQNASSKHKEDLTKQDATTVAGFEEAQNLNTIPVDILNEEARDTTIDSQEESDKCEDGAKDIKEQKPEDGANKSILSGSEIEQQVDTEEIKPSVETEEKTEDQRLLHAIMTDTCITEQADSQVGSAAHEEKNEEEATQNDDGREEFDNPSVREICEDLGSEKLSDISSVKQDEKAIPILNKVEDQAKEHEPYKSEKDQGEEDACISTQTESQVGIIKHEEKNEEEVIESDNSQKEVSDSLSVKEVCEETGSEKVEYEEEASHSESSRMNLNEKGIAILSEESDHEVNILEKGQGDGDVKSSQDEMFEGGLHKNNHHSESNEPEVIKTKESTKEDTEEIRSSVQTTEETEQQISTYVIPTDVCISTETQPEEGTTQNEEKNDEEAIESDDGYTKKSGIPMVKEVFEETVSKEAKYDEQLKLSDISNIALNGDEIASKVEDQEKEHKLYMSEVRLNDPQEASEQNENGANNKIEQKPEESVNKIVHSSSKLEEKEYTEDIKPCVDTDEKEPRGFHPITTDACISTQTESFMATGQDEEHEEVIEKDNIQKENSDNLLIKEVYEDHSEKLESEGVEVPDNANIKLNEKAIEILSRDEIQEKEQELNTSEQKQEDNDALSSQDAIAASIKNLQATIYEGEDKETEDYARTESIKDDTEDMRSSVERKEEVKHQALLHVAEGDEVKNEESFGSADGQKEKLVIPCVKEMCNDISSEKAESEGLKPSDSSNINLNEKAIATFKDEDQEKDQEVNMSTKDQEKDYVTSSEDATLEEDLKEKKYHDEGNEPGFVDTTERIEEDAEEIKSSVDTKDTLEQQGLLHVITTNVCSSTQTNSKEETMKNEEKNDAEAIENDDGLTKTSESPLVDELCEVTGSEKAESEGLMTLNEDELASKKVNQEKERELIMSEVQSGGHDVISTQNASCEDIKETTIGQHGITVAYFEERQGLSSLKEIVKEEEEVKSINAQEEREQSENGVKEKVEQKSRESINKPVHEYSEIIEGNIKEDEADAGSSKEEVYHEKSNYEAGEAGDGTECKTGGGTQNMSPENKDDATGNVNRKVDEEQFYVTLVQRSIDSSEQENISYEQVEKKLQEDTQNVEDVGSENPCTITQEIIKAIGSQQEFQESQSKTNEEIETKLDTENEVDRTEYRSEIKDEVILTEKTSLELAQHKEQNIQDIQTCLTKSVSEKTEDEITRKDEKLCHDSMEDTNGNTSKDEKCFLDRKAREIEILTLEHKPIEEHKHGDAEVSSKQSTDLNVTTVVEPQEEIMCFSSLGTSTEDTSNLEKVKVESEILKVEDLEPVSEVQILEVVSKSEDSNMKEEDLISSTTTSVGEEKGTAMKDISSDEKLEQTTEIKSEHPSIVSLDAILIEEELGRSSEKECTIADETISKSKPQEAREENVKQTLESDEMKSNDPTTEPEALEQLKKSHITTEENVSQLEQIGENNSLCDNRDVEENVAQKDQFSSTEDYREMVNETILTEEIEQVPLEIQVNKGRNDFKEQVPDESNYPTELQKTTQNLKEIANEISYSDPIPVQTPEVREARENAEIGQNLQAAEDISCELKASSNISALERGMEEGTKESGRIHREVENDNVDEALKEEIIPTLENDATLKPQVNLSDLESVVHPSESEKLPIQPLESVSHVQTPDVVVDSGDLKVKEECIVLETTEHADENNVVEEQKIKNNESSSAEKNEQTMENKQVAEPSSILCLDEVLVKEELGRSSEYNNTKEEENDKQTPVKSDEVQRSDISIKEKALTKENLELQGEFEPTFESIIREDQVDNTKPQAEQSNVTCLNDQILESKLEDIIGKDIADGKSDMEHVVILAPENQIYDSENQSEMIKNVILIDKLDAETEGEKGRNEVKQQDSKEDNYPIEFEKTSTSDQKELANETEYSKLLPVGNIGVTEVKVESHIEMENIQATEDLISLSKESSTAETLKTDMDEGNAQTATIIEEAKGDSIDETPKDKTLAVLEDAKALELQVNLPEVETTDAPSNGQEIIEEKRILDSQLTEKEILEGSTKAAPNLEFEQKEKDDEVNSEIQTSKVFLKTEIEGHLEATNDTCVTLMGELSSEKLLNELKDSDAKENIEVIVTQEEKVVEDSYKDGVAEVAVHEYLSQTEEVKAPNEKPEELTSPTAEDQTNELVLETDKTKVEQCNISNKDLNPEIMEEEITKTFSEDQRSIKERSIREEGQGDLGIENKEAKSGNEVLLEVETNKESTSIKDNINEESSCIHNQLISTSDEVCQTESVIISSNELLETKGSVEDTHDPKLMVENLNLKAEPFIVMQGTNEDMKQTVEKTHEINASEFKRLENMEMEEKIIASDANMKKETTKEPQADDPAKTTSDSILNSKKQDTEVKSESRGHGDMPKLEEKATEVFKIMPEVSEIVPEDREVSAILAENVQETSPKMLREKYEPEITTTSEKIEEKIKDEDKSLVNMYLSASTQEVAWLSNEETEELQVSRLYSEIDGGKQNGPGSMLNEEREAVPPQEHISNIKSVDMPSYVEIREQGESVHCGSQEPSEDNTLLPQNDKDEDSLILPSVDKDIIQSMEKRSEDSPVIDVHNLEKSIDDTTTERVVDVVNNAECSEIEQQNLNTKQATLETINQENPSEQKKEAKENAMSEMPINKTIAEEEIMNEVLVMSVAKEEDGRNYLQDHLKDKEYSGERKYQDLEAVKEPFHVEKLSDVEKAGAIDIQKEIIFDENLQEDETEERTNIAEPIVNSHDRSIHTEAAIPIEDVKSSDVELQGDMDVPVPKYASTRNPEFRSTDIEVPPVMDATADKVGYKKDPNDKTVELYDADKDFHKDVHLKSTCNKSKTTEEISGMKQEPLELDGPVTPGTAATEDLEITRSYATDDLIQTNKVSTSTVDRQSPNKPRENESIDRNLLIGIIDASHEQGEPTAKLLNAEEENLKATKGKEPQCSSEVVKEDKKMSDEKEKSEPTEILYTDILHESMEGNSGGAENLAEERENALTKDHQVDKEETGDDGVKTGEENEEEEDDEDNQKMGSCSDAPVMVEASKDMEVKAHKKSHNILSGVGSKVKHSIAKVKKAITGKSSHPKPPSPKERD